MFDNPDLAPAELPSADGVDWQSLHPRFVRRLQVNAVFTAVAVFVGLTAFALLPLPPAERMPAWLPGAVAVALLLQGLAWPAISVPKKGYALRRRDILYRSGVAWQTVSAIPFNRVQHVETASTPLDRRFGLATLKLYTAASAGGDLKIHGMPADVAERLRAFLLEQVGDEPEAG